MGRQSSGSSTFIATDRTSRASMRPCSRQKRDLATRRVLPADPAAQRVAQSILIADTRRVIALGARDRASCIGGASLDGREQMSLFCRLMDLLWEALEIGDQSAELVEVGRCTRSPAAAGDGSYGKQHGRHRPLPVPHHLEGILHGGEEAMPLRRGH